MAKTGGRIAARRRFPVLLGLFLVVLTLSCHQTDRAQNDQSGTNAIQTATVSNVEPRREAHGEIIDAHDGCLQFFNGRFYLYGTAYGLNHSYELTNHAYRVYSSPDLARWTFDGELLHGQPNGIYFRPYVVFNPSTRKYVLWYNWYPEKWDGQTGAALSDSPVGPFTIVNPNVRLAHAHPGDGSLFVDDDGTGYYIYTAIGEGYTVRVERLTPDYLAATGETSSILAAGCEAPVLFRRKNVYYALCGPRCDACPQGSETQFFAASSPLGPFATKPQWNINRHLEDEVPSVASQGTNGLSVTTPEGTYTVHPQHHTPVINTTNAPNLPAQETWVAKFPTPTGPVFIWMADRWQSSPDGYQGHDFQFWEPLEFSPEGEIRPLKGVTRWQIPLPQ